MKRVATNKAPGAIGPYSQAVIHNGLVYASGQIPLSPDTGEIEGADIRHQAKQVCENIQGVLEASGSCLSCVIKTTCFLADMDDFGTFNEVYGSYFVDKPARSCVAVKGLPRGVLCEVEVIAALCDDPSFG